MSQFFSCLFICLGGYSIFSLFLLFPHSQHNFYFFSFSPPLNSSFLSLSLYTYHLSIPFFLSFCLSNLAYSLSFALLFESLFNFCPQFVYLILFPLYFSLLHFFSLSLSLSPYLSLLSLSLHHLFTSHSFCYTLFAILNFNQFSLISFFPPFPLLSLLFVTLQITIDLYQVEICNLPTTGYFF